MHTLICYDIADAKRLLRVTKVCEGVGVRIHNSAFRAELDTDELLAVQRNMLRVIAYGEDVVRYIPLCDFDWRATRHMGDSEAVSAQDASNWVV